eukprot:TRINITY_DN14022_c0_g2_i1.p1 TRINITY_DN14022_c0_g2~~TRINITY_DN14022_c0_g2_i1.p1  ORF type:complete len:784 (+),score=178.49 TRINITY_DN14022_c0_g2_i1:78-2429(+)
MGKNKNKNKKKHVNDSNANAADGSSANVEDGTAVDNTAGECTSAVATSPLESKADDDCCGDKSVDSAANTSAYAVIDDCGNTSTRTADSGPELVDVTDNAGDGGSAPAAAEDSALASEDAVDSAVGCLPEQAAKETVCQGSNRDADSVIDAASSGVDVCIGSSPLNAAEAADATACVDPVDAADARADVVDAADTACSAAADADEVSGAAEAPQSVDVGLADAVTTEDKTAAQTVPVDALDTFDSPQTFDAVVADAVTADDSTCAKAVSGDAGPLAAGGNASVRDSPDSSASVAVEESASPGASPNAAESMTAGGNGNASAAVRAAADDGDDKSSLSSPRSPSSPSGVGGRSFRARGSDYGIAAAGASGGVDAIDAIIRRAEGAVVRLSSSDLSAVMRPKAEMDLLSDLELARNFMGDLATSSAGNRQSLIDIFGGDCHRVASLRAVLEASVLTDRRASDQRVRQCADACDMVTNVLLDKGLAERLREAGQRARQNLRAKRDSVTLNPQDVAKIAASASAAKGSTAAARPKRLKPAADAALAGTKLKRVNLMAEEWRRNLDEDLISRILACETAEALSELSNPVEASKAKSVGTWMIWMVQRVHVNDPTLRRLDFANKPMPSPKLDARVAPRLVAAVATNTHLEELLLSCSGLVSAQARALAEALRQNRTVRVLNVESNRLEPEAVQALADAVGSQEMIEEFRCNETATGFVVFDACLKALRSNRRLCKLGLRIDDHILRAQIDNEVLRNNDLARARRVEARRQAAAEAEAATALAAETATAP